MSEILVRIKSSIPLTVDNLREVLVVSFDPHDFEVVDLMNEPATPEREPDEY